MAADGSSLTRTFAADEPGNILGPPAWSPDGQKIAFISVAFILVDPATRGFTLEGGLYTISPEDSGQRKAAEVVISPDSEPVGSLSWSPDGTEILFTVRKGTEEYVYVVKADGAGDGRVASGPYRQWTGAAQRIISGSGRYVAPGSYASWSPDGSRIAVISESPGSSVSANYLTTMMPDGSDVQFLVTRDEDGDLKAVNAARCFLWFCQ